MADNWIKPINNGTPYDNWGGHYSQPSVVPAVQANQDVTKTTQPFKENEYENWPQGEENNWMPQVGGLANPAYAKNLPKYKDQLKNSRANDYIDGPAFTNNAADAALSTRANNLKTYSGINYSNVYGTTDSGRKYGPDSDGEYMRGYLKRYYPYFPYLNKRGEGRIPQDALLSTIRNGLKSRHPDWTDTQLSNSGAVGRAYYDLIDTDSNYYEPNKESTQNIADAVQGVM